MQHRDREWADMVLFEELGRFMGVYVHAPDAVAVGVRPEAILAVLEGRFDDLTDEERVKDEFVRAVARGTMTADLYGRVGELVGQRAAVELVCFTGHLVKTCRLTQAFGLPDTTREHAIEWVQAIVDGKVAIPDARARIPSPEAAARAVSN